MRRAISQRVLAAAFLLSSGMGGLADVVVCRTYIPTAAQPHGEVRLIRRADAVGVQTLLYTPSLRRGLQKIRQREEANWPPNRTGHADSQTYLAVLSQGKTAALEAFARRSDRNDIRKLLLIEVMCEDSGGSVRTALPELTGAEDAIKISATHPVTSSPVTAAYARAAMEIILQSAFHRPGRTLDEFLSGAATHFEPLTDEQLSQPVPR